MQVLTQSDYRYLICNHDGLCRVSLGIQSIYTILESGLPVTLLIIEIYIDQ